MSKDNLRTLVRNIDSDLFELINHVICSICQELLTKPVTTPCGHSFCSACIKRVISSKDNSGCPLCKNPVKRYCLETDQVKSTLTEIFRELPAAFEKDVQDLSAHFNDTAEDLMKNSKLTQLTGQDYEKDVKSSKRKTPFSKKSQKPSNKSKSTEANCNDVDSFVPILKRSKNVIEYASAKKKKMDDLVSISQREVESDSGICDTSGLDKKLEQIEKVSPEEKINEWFKAVGSNIYLSSPGMNYFDLPPTKNTMESQVLSKDAKGDSTNNSSSMIRRDYKKVVNPFHSEKNEKESDTKVVIDPYEFVPSQNKKRGKRRGRKCVEKKIPDFKALHSFTKESIKRNTIILDEDKEDSERENEAEVSDKSPSEFPAVKTPDAITASQKFDKLLSESKENEKKESVKAHVLYSASQASSTQFLDCSYQSQVAEVKKAPKKRSRVSFRKTIKSIPSSEQESVSNLIPKRTGISTKCPNTRTRNIDEGGSAKSEQKHGLDGDEAKADKRQSFSEIMDLKSEEALDLEKSVEEYLMRFKKDNKSLKGTSLKKTYQQTKTKLLELLGELVNDNIVYKNHPRNAPVELKNQQKAEKNDSEVSSCEKNSQQSKTKLMELLEQLVNDETVYRNHPRNTPMELKNRQKAKDREIDSKVFFSEKTFQQTKTKLTELLEELVNDDVVYKNHPRNAPVELKNGRKAEDDFEGHLKKPPWNLIIQSSSDHTSHQQQNISYNSKSSGKEETTKSIDDLKSGKFTQGTHLLGFCTQEELTGEKMFKEMVKNMEKELELSENDLKRTPLGQCNEEREENSALNNSYGKEYLSPNSKLSRNELENPNFITFNCLGKIRKSKSCFINFLRLGRLTPTVKRSRSSVVKLVFPIGLSSFARKRVIQDKLLTGVSTSESLLSTSEISLKNENCVPSSRNDHVSTEIQTSHRLVSSAEIQTSNISKSVIVQTSQVLKPSVEVQTVKENCSAGIQTSQMPSPQKSRIYKSAEIQTSQPSCESCRANLPLLRDNTNDVETGYIPGSVGYDEPEFFPKKNNSRDFDDTECSFRKLRSSKDRTCSLEKEIGKTLSPPRLSNKNKRKSLSPAKKHFYKHRKISSGKNIAKERSWSPESKTPEKTEDDRFQDQQCSSSLIVDSEMKREFDETWMKKSQKSHEDLVETENKRNRGEEALDRESEISSPTEKERHSLSHLTQNLSGLIDEVLQKFETRQRIPLDVRKVSPDDDYEMIDLGTPESVQQNSQDQVVQVLKNIDLDLKGKESRKGTGKGAWTGENVGNSTKGEKSEESDSDFFVEQTPPRPSNSRIVDQESVNSSKFETRRSSYIEKVDKEEDNEKNVLNSQGTDLIGDSLPKDLMETESFLMVSGPQKVVLTPEKRESHNVSYIEKRGKSGSQSFPKEKSFSTIKKLENFPKPNENDQNQLNAGSEAKSNQLKTWVKVDESPRVKVGLQSRQKLCVVASSVKNMDMIKKFVIKFKMEYSNKPTKNMTHLIVGMHESEEGEVLPLCTPKLLFAMANKKWIVSESWAETCLKMDMIVPEETFEALDPVGGQGCRNARLSTQPLLKDCEIYLLGNFQAISKEDFAGLILDCGGTVIQKPEQFSFSPLKLRMIVADQDCLNMDKSQLQELHETYSTVILSRDVILMSIQSYKLANFNPHLLHPTSEEELLKMGYPSQLVKSEEEDSSSNWNNSK